MSTESQQPLDEKRREIETLKARSREVQQEVLVEEAKPLWRPSGFYGTYYALTGSLLGMAGAMTSLLFNIIGSTIAGKNPLELIRIYLTFPLGEKALALTSQADNVFRISNGVVLAIGCCLYLFTGMLLGIPIQMAMNRFAANGGLVLRLVVASVVSLLIWGVNFYGILSWLQPALFGGNWITDPEYLPAWVAIATHLVFGGTMALLYPFGVYQPYERPTEE